MDGGETRRQKDRGKKDRCLDRTGRQRDGRKTKETNEGSRETEAKKDRCIEKTDRWKKDARKCIKDRKTEAKKDRCRDRKTDRWKKDARK